MSQILISRVLVPILIHMFSPAHFAAIGFRLLSMIKEHIVDSKTPFDDAALLPIINAFEADHGKDESEPDKSLSQELIDIGENSVKAGLSGIIGI